MVSDTPNRFLSEVDAAAYLRVSIHTLRDWRRGRGSWKSAPMVVRQGRSVRYDTRELDRWLAAREGEVNRAPAVDEVNGGRLLRESEAAAVLGFTKHALRAWRVGRGSATTGPPFVRVGRSVRYSSKALARWIESRTVSAV